MIAGRTRIRIREEEKAERRREQERRRRERKLAELKAIRLEFQRKQKEEGDKVKALFEDAKNWQFSEILRAYVNAVVKKGGVGKGRTEPHQEIGRWKKWALEQADRMDPLRPSPHSVLDEKYDDTEEKKLSDPYWS